MPSKRTVKKTPRKPGKVPRGAVRSQRHAAPRPRRRAQKQNYEIVAVSLFPTEYKPLLEITADLKKINRTISRSLVARWALSRLARELRGKTSAERHQAFFNWLQEEATSASGRKS